MSNFGDKLTELLERKKIRASDLSRAIGISEGLISRWINGKQIFVSVQHLGEVATFISELPQEQAELIRAHLLDHIPNIEGRQILNININSIKDAEDVLVMNDEPTPALGSTLPLKAQREFQVIMEAYPFDADIRSMISGLAGVLQPAKKRKRGGEASKTDNLDKATEAIQEDFHKKV